MSDSKSYPERNPCGEESCTRIWGKIIMLCMASAVCGRVGCKATFTRCGMAFCAKHRVSCHKCNEHDPECDQCLYRSRHGITCTTCMEKGYHPHHKWCDLHEECAGVCADTQTRWDTYCEYCKMCSEYRHCFRCGKHHSMRYDWCGECAACYNVESPHCAHCGKHHNLGKVWCDECSACYNVGYPHCGDCGEHHEKEKVWCAQCSQCKAYRHCAHCGKHHGPRGIFKNTVSSFFMKDRTMVVYRDYNRTIISLVNVSCTQSCKNPPLRSYRYVKLLRGIQEPLDFDTLVEKVISATGLYPDVAGLIGSYVMSESILPNRRKMVCSYAAYLAFIQRTRGALGVSCTRCGGELFISLF